MTRVSVNQGRPTFLWQRSTPVIVGCWFAGRTWKNKKNDVRHKLEYARGMETHARHETARSAGHLLHYSCHVVSVIVL